MTTTERDDEDPENGPGANRGLPPDIRRAIDEFEEGLRNHSPLLDCLWGELYGAINANQWTGNITPEFADRLRQRYLYNYGDEDGPDRLQ